MKKIWLALAGMIWHLALLLRSLPTANSIRHWKSQSLASLRFWSSSRSIAHIAISSSRCCMFPIT